MAQQHDPIDTLRPAAARHRVRRVVLTGVAGAAILGSGSAYAYASGDGNATDTTSSSTSGTPAAPSPPPTPVDAPKPGPHIDGTVKSVDGDVVTVTDPDGFTRTVKTSANTKYDGVSAPLAAGTKVHATGTVDADGTSLDATAISAMPHPEKEGPPAPGGNAPAAPPAGTTFGAPSTPAGGVAGPDGAPPAPSDTPSDAPSGSPSIGSPSTGS